MAVVDRLRSAAALLALIMVLVTPASARADGTQRTWNYLTTGNGHGFQVYDLNKNRITTFLEHPYRYVAPRADPTAEGIGRRNLAFDFYFGIRGGSVAGWLGEPSSASDPEYLD